MEKTIELATAIENLRAQLQQAIKEGDDKDLRFEVQDIEVELKCCVKSEEGLNAGAKFYIFNVGASGKISDETVQTIKLKLRPVDAEGNTKLLSDEVEGLK